MGILPHGIPHLFSMSMYHRTGSYLKQYTIHVKEGHLTFMQYTNCIKEWRPTFILYDCQATEGSSLFIPRPHHSESHLCLFSVNIMPQKGHRVFSATVHSAHFSLVNSLQTIAWMSCILSILYLNPASLISASRHWASCFVRQPKAKTPNVTISGYKLDL